MLQLQRASVRQWFTGRLLELPRNQYNAPDLRYVSAERWEAFDLKRCKKCHPSGIPPFTDCPHGHVLSVQRLSMQLQWEQIRTGWARTGIAVALMYVTRYLWILAWAPILIIWLLSMIQFAYHRHCQRKMQGFLVGHPEAYNFIWEKKYWGFVFGRFISRYLGQKPINEPWLKRVF